MEKDGTGRPSEYGQDSAENKNRKDGDLDEGDDMGVNQAIYPSKRMKRNE